MGEQSAAPRDGSTALVVAMVAVVFVMAAPAGGAAPVRVAVTPTPAAQASRVSLTVEGCKGDEAHVSSGAFARGEVTARADGAAHRLTGEADLKRWVSPGHYGVNVACDGRSYASIGSVDVVGSGPGEGPGTADTSGDRDHGVRDHDAYDHGDRGRGEWDGNGQGERDERDGRGGGRWDGSGGGTRGPRSDGSYGVMPHSSVATGGGAAATLVAARQAPGGTGARAAAAEDPERGGRTPDEARGTKGPGTAYWVLGLVLAGASVASLALRGVRRGSAAGRDTE